ncbi:MAG: hypothetical protein MI784_14570, partial [Cytophagales bacterium]|nr:hypothetical protein [Cytophagales bacterium]
MEIAWEIQHISLSPEHFHVKNLGAALSVIALQDHRWHIHFPFSFKKNKSYTLEIDSLQLENGQWIPSQSVPFVWDTQKPKLFSWHLFADSLLLTFNEPVILPPKSSVSVIPENKLDKLQQISESSLFLRFADSMPQETIIQLSLAIQDLQGNLSEIKSEIDWDIRPPRLHGYYLLSADSLVLQLNEPAYFPALKPENFSLGGLTPVFIDQFRDAEEILLVFSRKLLCLDSALTARNIFDRKFNKQEYISTKISAHLPFAAHVQFLNAR